MAASTAPTDKRFMQFGADHGNSGQVISRQFDILQEKGSGDAGAMKTADAHSAGTRAATRIQDGRSIPTGSSGADYLDELDKYLDRLLDEALEGTFPASDPLAVPTRRDVEKK